MNEHARYVRARIAVQSIFEDKERASSLMADVLEQLARDLEQGETHILELGVNVDHELTWAISHPVSCRPALLDCQYHKQWLREMEVEGFPAEPGGRYAMKLPTETFMLFKLERLP